METLELQCADAWRPPAGANVGDWRLRAAEGFTGRANSALAVGDPGMPVSDALDRVCEFAHSHGLRPKIQTVVDSKTERALEESGWVPDTGHAAGHLVSVLVGPLGPDSDRAEILDGPTPSWWELTAGVADPSAAQRHVLTTGEIGYGVAEITAGAVRAAVVGELLHISRLAVRPEHRRRGLASALMAACGPWAAARGATRCALQVAVGNEAALALYAGLGFTEHHRYRYWVRPCEDRSS